MTSGGSQESGSQPQASDPDRQVEIVADMLDLIWKRQAEAAVHLAAIVVQCFNTKICQAKEIGG